MRTGWVAEGILEERVIAAATRGSTGVLAL
jgi:hypothetical protein